MKKRAMHRMDNVNPLNGIMGFFYGSPKWLSGIYETLHADSSDGFFYYEDSKSITERSNRDSTMSKGGFRFPHIDNAESDKKHTVIEKKHGLGGSKDLKIEITISYDN